MDFLELWFERTRVMMKGRKESLFPARETHKGCESLVVNPGPAGYGGLLRDSFGNWIQGFIG